MLTVEKKLNTPNAYEEIRLEMERESAWFEREKPVMNCMTKAQEGKETKGKDKEKATATVKGKGRPGSSGGNHCDITTGRSNLIASLKYT